MSNNLLTIAAQLLDSGDRRRILMAGATAWGTALQVRPHADHKGNDFFDITT
jgi:hypothetical protein